MQKPKESIFTSKKFCISTFSVLTLLGATFLSYASFYTPLTVKAAYVPKIIGSNSISSNNINESSDRLSFFQPSPILVNKAAVAKPFPAQLVADNYTYIGPLDTEVYIGVPYQDFGSGVVSWTSINNIPINLVNNIQIIQVPNGYVTVQDVGVIYITFTPNSGFYGTTVFAYTAEDQTGQVGKGSNSITTKPAQPFGVDHYYTTPFNTDVIINPLTGAVGVNVSLTDFNGIVPIVGVPIQLQYGSLVKNLDSTYTFSPTPGFFGVERIDWIGEDSFQQSFDNAEYITVSQALPVASNDNYVTDKNTPINLYPLVGDTGLELLIKSINGVQLIEGVAQNGIIVPNGTVDKSALGLITFKPTNNFIGTTSFQYEMYDSGGGNVTVSALETITVLGSINDTKSTSINKFLTYNPLTNDSVATGSVISAINNIPVVPGDIVTLLTGSIKLNFDGMLTVTPSIDSISDIVFSYEVTTPSSFGLPIKTQADDTIIIVETKDDLNTTNIDTPITYSPLTNDRVPAGSRITAINDIPVVIGLPILIVNGEVVVNADGTITVTPTNGFRGILTFGYQVSTFDGFNIKATDTISIVGEENNIPSLIRTGGANNNSSYLVYQLLGFILAVFTLGFIVLPKNTGE
jgi:large repetitive protein